MKAASTSVPAVNLWTVPWPCRSLSDMGVDNIITFDAHDPRVQNAIPLKRL